MKWQIGHDVTGLAECPWRSLILLPMRRSRPFDPPRIDRLARDAGPLDAALLLPSVVARQLGDIALPAQCRLCPIPRLCGGGRYTHRYLPGTGFGTRRSEPGHCGLCRAWPSGQASLGQNRASSTSPEVFGAVALAVPPDRVTGAVTLAHEIQHVKLGAPLDVVTLTLPDDGTRYHAPWRDDPRPLGTLLQGAYGRLTGQPAGRIRSRASYRDTTGHRRPATADPHLTNRLNCPRKPADASMAQPLDIRAR